MDDLTKKQVWLIMPRFFFFFCFSRVSKEVSPPEEAAISQIANNSSMH
ncbi:hypothetical protein [Janthinobacterium tructae]|nr:hypothetical protein [Janthinobacterium tructae]